MKAPCASCTKNRVLFPSVIDGRVYQLCLDCVDGGIREGAFSFDDAPKDLSLNLTRRRFIGEDPGDR